MRNDNSKRPCCCWLSLYDPDPAPRDAGPGRTVYTAHATNPAAKAAPNATVYDPCLVCGRRLACWVVHTERNDDGNTILGH